MSFQVHFLAKVNLTPFDWLGTKPQFRPATVSVVSAKAHVRSNVVPSWSSVAYRDSMRRLRGLQRSKRKVPYFSGQSNEA